MATFSELGGVAVLPDFQARVQYAMSVMAVSVYTENASLEGHDLRLAYAAKVLVDDFNLVGACFGILADPTIAGEAEVDGSGIQDAHIANAVSNIWNQLAGFVP